MNKTIIHKKRAISLTLSIVAVLIFSIFIFAVSAVLIHTIDFIKGYEAFIDDRYYAEAGVEKGIWLIKNDPASVPTSLANVGASFTTADGVNISITLHFNKTNEYDITANAGNETITVHYYDGKVSAWNL